MPREGYFKIYLENDDKTEIRKFMFSESFVAHYSSFAAKVQSVFPTLQGRNFTIHWRDNAGDLIDISTDEELSVALEDMTFTSGYKFIVKLAEDDKRSSAEAVYNPLISVEFDLDVPVFRCLCNHCDADIDQFRYKCLECDDYDLCSKCEAQSIHPKHFMLRIPIAGSNWRHKIPGVLMKFMENTANISAAQKHAQKHGHKCGRNRRTCRRIAKAESAMKYFGLDLNHLQSDAETEERFDFAKLLGTVRDFMVDHATEFMNEMESKEPPKEDKKSGTKNQTDQCTSCEKDESKSNDAGSEKAETVDEWMLIGDNETAVIEDKSKSKATQEKESTTDKEDENKSVMSKSESSVLSEAISQKDSEEKSDPPPKTTTGDEKNIYPNLNDGIFHPDPKIQAAVQYIMDMGITNQGGLVTYLVIAESGNIDKVLDLLLR